MTVAADTRPALLYSDSCRQCRRASRVVTALGLGQLRRVAIGTDEADRLYARSGGRPGQLGVVRGDRFYGAFAIPLGIAAAWRDRLR